jgi:FkbM family methyltransferase
MNNSEYWLKEPVEAALGRLSVKEIAVDVGANVGTWTEALAKQFDKVFAIEPDERASSQIHEADNVTIIRSAVSDESGNRPLYLRRSTGHNSLLEDHPIGGDGMSHVPAIEKKIVPVYSLDDLFPDGADFVKMDIEGAEVQALAGCENLSSWKRTLFIVECHDAFDDVQEQLVRLGKKVTRIPHPLHAHPGHCWAIAE